MMFRRTLMYTITKAVLLCVLIVLPVSAQNIVRGPYLQQGTDNSIIVKWRTDTATDSRVDFGTTAGILDQSVLDDATATTEHEVRLTGLSPNTQYFYAIGDSSGLQVGDNSYRFRTAPTSDSTGSTRIWVIGDSGTADASAAVVRDAYKNFTGSTETHLWLMLGDNAYNNGTDSEYQAAVFDTYPEMLRQVPLWPTLGNHDGHTADSATQTGPYYDIFTLPKNGEAGGVASGTEAYYSFEYRNIHFVVLDSYESNRASNGPMLTWLENDLAANQKEWVVAYWHHPPYTKGSHDSDRETALIEMRENALPILEDYGVDLVLTGHSHSYERSFLIDGHYGASSTFDPVLHLVDGGDGRPGSDGAYAKSSDIAAPNAGAVYAVAGSSGKTGGGALDHPVMFYSVNTLGSMILDINGNQLDAKFLNSAGSVLDAFTISKGPDTTPPVVKAVTANDSTTLKVGYSEPLARATAQNVSNYTISGGVTISTASLEADGSSVVLAVSPLIPGVTYTLSVNQVEDLAGNAIDPDTQQQFNYQILSTIEFQNGMLPTPDYSGSRDTYVSQDLPNSNFGNHAELLVDGDDPSGTGNDLATLIAWDLSAVPPNATIVSGGITFEVFNQSNSTYEIFQLLRDWQEGQATWNQAANSSSWDSAGAQGPGDRANQVLGSIAAGNTGSYTVDLNSAGITVIQNWIAGITPNYGFILARSSSGDGLDMRSGEYTSPANRPRLNLVYSLPSDSDLDGIENRIDNCIEVANPDQRDTDEDGYGNRCDPDLNNDGIVNTLDIIPFKTAFGTSGPHADFDGDGVVSTLDIVIFKAYFGQAPGPAASGNN